MVVFESYNPRFTNVYVLLVTVIQGPRPHINNGKKGSVMPNAQLKSKYLKYCYHCYRVTH